MRGFLFAYHFLLQYTYAYMKFFSNNTTVFIAVVICTIASISGVLFAKQGDTMFGYAWSSNIGWISTNNCIDDQNCSGVEYGITIQPDGTITGSAWSSNIGWISFDAPSVAGCPSGLCKAYVERNADGTYKEIDGVYVIKGWARVCSVFASGCSGPLRDIAPESGGAALDIYRGGWDGFIGLQTNDAIPWGITINPQTGILSGYGWGSTVVGWVSFNGVKTTFVEAQTPVVTLTANPIEVPKSGDTTTLTVQASFIADATSCRQNTWNTNLTMTQQSDGTWLGTSSVAVPKETIYSVTCSGKKDPKGVVATATATTTVYVKVMCPIAGQIPDTQGTCCSDDKKVGGICFQTFCPPGQTKDTKGACCTDANKIDGVCQAAPSACPAGKLLDATRKECCPPEKMNADQTCDCTPEDIAQGVCTTIKKRPLFIEF